MYTSPLTKEEIISRIVKEHEMYLLNAARANTATERDMYTRKAATIETLMKVLDMKEGR